jgi:FkbM family methyltransferase
MKEKLNSKKRDILYSLESIPQGFRIAIYGSGKIGSGFKLTIEKAREDLKVVFYINTFNSGQRDGIQIMNLDELEANKHLFDVIVIASSQWNEIEDELTKRDLSFFVISNELMYGTLDIRALGSFRFERNKREEIGERLNRVLSFFDNEDKYFFELLSDLRLSDNESNIFDFLKSVSQTFKVPYLDYIDKDFKGDVILEGGVSDGTDSVHFYNFFTNENLKIYGFEPFIEAFEASEHMQALIQKGMELFPWALWDEDKDMFFNKNEFSTSTSSVVRNNPDHVTGEYTTVKGCKIDSFVNNMAIDSISLFKLDIEGAEMEALEGAREMIRKFRPQLAISIYHKKEHLYEIPEFLKELHPGYKFKLGFYSSTFIDTILYALP